jgi:hypothetical protein
MANHVEKMYYVIFWELKVPYFYFSKTVIFNSFHNFIEKSSIFLYFETKFGSCRDSHVELRWGWSRRVAWVINLVEV